MSFIERCAHAFEPRVRARGEEYVRAARVEIRRADEAGVVALVQGSERRPYLADVEVVGAGALRLRCDCRFTLAGTPCKHLWAVLVDASRQALISLPEDDREVVIECAGSAGAQRFPAGAAALDDARVRPPAAAREPDRGERGAARASRRGSGGEGDEGGSPGHHEGRGPGVTGPLEYRLVRGPDAEAGAALTIRFYRRLREQDGRPGPARLQALSGRDLELLDDAADREILGLLLGSAGGLRAGSSSGGGVSQVSLLAGDELARGSRLHQTMLQAVLPRLCATGRFVYVAPAEAEGAGAGVERPALRWDPGPPWRLRLRLDARAEGGFRVFGVLERGRADPPRSEADVGEAEGSGAGADDGRATGGEGAETAPPMSASKRGATASSSSSSSSSTGSRSGAGSAQLSLPLFDTCAPTAASAPAPSQGGEETRSGPPPARQRLLTEVEVLGRSGVARSGDELFTLAPDSVAWALAFSRSGATTVDPGDEVTLLSWLCGQPGLPSLDLDPAIGWRVEPGRPRPHLDLIPAIRGRQHLRARIGFWYGQARLKADSPASAVCDESARTIVLRDRVGEARAVHALQAWLSGQASAPTLAAVDDEAVPVETPEQADGGEIRGPSQDPLRPHVDVVDVPVDGAAARLHALLVEGWSVAATGRPMRACQELDIDVRSDGDGFEVEVEADFGGPTAGLAAVLDAGEGGDGFVDLGEAGLGLLPPPWLRALALLGRLARTRRGRGLRFRRSQVAVVVGILADLPPARTDATFEDLRAGIAAGVDAGPAAPPPDFRGTLRGYQEQGLGWMACLQAVGVGGCLADDMGLGKTVQVLALLARRRAEAVAGGRHRPSLIALPRSLIFNWCEEAERFAPGLRVLDYTGPERHARRGRAGAPFADCDLVLTTYGVLRRDIDILSEIDFDYVILDEAQNIKNPDAKAARAARRLRAGHRLALTGTPVENHLRDLASIFEFLNPGMFGDKRALAALGAGGEADLPALARALRPLLLRRTKAQVLTELPAKSEQVRYVVLDREERARYDQLLAHYQASLGRTIARPGGLGQGRMHVLEALLRLRQVACHPGLIEPALGERPSSKLAVLLADLEELAEAGHKALVFSQFTTLLGIARRHIEACGLVCEYLDGRTRDRQARVARFQEDPDCQVFLISLKAGGSGLNLTAADYVFLLDPWWNPAVEAQAIDRAHRIGQTRPVMAYRLIARDTVEDKVLRLQHDKRALAEAVVSAQPGPLGGLSVEDVRLLLG